MGKPKYGASRLMSHARSPPLQPLGELVGHLRLHRVAGRPTLKELAELRQIDEVVLRLAQFRLGIRQRGAWFAEFDGVVGGAALVAIVARLVGRAAARAVAAYLPIRQKQPAFGVEELLDVRREGIAAIAQARIDETGEPFVLRRMSGVVVVVADVEAAEILRVFVAQPIDQHLGPHAFALGQQHRRGAVGVVRANVDALVAAHTLKPHPDVRLDVLEQVPEMNGPVGVGQGAGDEYAAHGGGSNRGSEGRGTIAAFDCRFCQSESGRAGGGTI